MRQWRPARLSQNSACRRSCRESPDPTRKEEQTARSPGNAEAEAWISAATQRETLTPKVKWAVPKGCGAKAVSRLPCRGKQSCASVCTAGKRAQLCQRAGPGPPAMMSKTSPQADRYCKIIRNLFVGTKQILCLKS